MRTWPTAAEARWGVEAAAGERGPVATLAEGFLQVGGAPAQAACLLFLALGVGLLVAGDGAIHGAGLWPRNAPVTTGGGHRNASRRTRAWGAWLRGLVAGACVLCIPAFVTDAQGGGPSILAGCGVVAGALAWRVGARCRAPAVARAGVRTEEPDGRAAPRLRWQLASVTILALTAGLAAPGGVVDAWLRGADAASLLRGEIVGVPHDRLWNDIGASAPMPWPLGVLLVGALLARPRAGLAALAWACVGGIVAGHAGVGMVVMALAWGDDAPDD